jgi:hypothetical protein
MSSPAQRPITLFAVLTLVIALFANTAPARANAAGGTAYTLQQLELFGDTSVGGLVDTSGTLVGDETGDLASADDSLQPLRTTSGAFTPPATLTPGGPNPAPQSRATSNPGFGGFNGLTHLDQRNAGTGIYANTQFSLEPPDQALCVGGGFVVESVNTALAVHKTDGTRIAGPTALNQFFGLAPEVDRAHGNKRGDFISDPKCYFDSDTGRWFLTLLQEDPKPSVRTHTLIAVSKTSDPTGAWFRLRIDTTDDGLNGTPNHAGCPCLGDQPLIGADHFGFYISTNEFPTGAGGFHGVQIYGMSKWSLAQGILPVVVHIDDLGVADGTDVSVQPGTTPSHRGDHDGGDAADEDDNGGTEYFLSGQFVFLDENLIAAWALTNTSSLSSATPSVQLSQAPITVEQYSLPISVRQKDGPRPLGTLLGQPKPRITMNDFRVGQAVYARGRLYGALNTRLQATDPNQGGRRDGVAWFIVKPSFDDGVFRAKLRAQGYVSLVDATVGFAGVAVNRKGQAALGFSIVGLNEFPSTGYATIDEKTGTSQVHVAAVCAAPADGFSGYAPNGVIERWGDYGAGVADENGNLWLANEYIPNAPRNLNANWGTFISTLTLSDGGED